MQCPEWLAIINGSDKDFEKLAGAIDNCDGSSEKMANINERQSSGADHDLDVTASGTCYQLRGNSDAKNP